MPKPLGDAPAFQAKTVDAWKTVASPIITSTKQIATAGAELRSAKKARDEQKLLAEQRASRKSLKKSSKPSAPTTASPVYGEAMRRVVALKQQQRNAPQQQSRPAVVPTTLPKPTTFEEIPQYAVTKAMQSQKQREMHRSVSYLQHKNTF